MKKISILLSIILLLSLFLVAFSGCDNDDGSSSSSSSDGKQVPVYQGMSISSAVGTVSSGWQFANSMANNGKEDFDYDKDNGKHNGHFKGDYNGNGQEVDQENPFPENDPDETIEEETKSTLEVIGSVDTIYYATPNQDIYINIHLSNPDNFEIMSFTLNGKKYSSYMFEDGSDMEKIVLKYNVGESAGIVEYTIDAIKYIDGTEIKDVIIDGNKTVKAGIKTDDQLVAEFTTPNIGTNSVSFFSTINDKRDLIAHSNGIIKAVIYDGEAIVAEKTLSTEKTEVVFDNLKTNSLYQYAVVAYYDDLSGVGEAMHVLYKSAFYTRPVVLFDNITVGKEGIEFDFKWNELYEGEEIKSLTLYYGQKQADIKVGEGISGSITGLLSGKTYTIYAEYDNKGNAEQIYLEFTTGTKIVPMLDFAMSDDGLGFLVIFTDSDEVITSKKVELIRGDTVQELEVLEEYDITKLLSNTEYTFKVTYIYDLNDGEGEHTVVREITVPTLTKVAPTLKITSAEITYTSVKFAVSLTDNDSVIKSTKTELVHGENVTLLENLPVYEFTDLLSNNEYTLRVTYVYDLGDGEGEHTEVKELSATTLAKAVPTVEITSPASTYTSVKFAVSVTDNDSVIKSTKTELVDGETVTALENLSEYSFSDLLSNKELKLRVTYVYDLNDGEGERTEVAELSVKTLVHQAPIMFPFRIGASAGPNSISYNLNPHNPDNVPLEYEVELYDSEGGFIAKSTTKQGEFSQLTCATTYEVRATIRFDLNDGNGVVLRSAAINISTADGVEVVECKVANSSAVSEGETIYLELKLENPSGKAVESVTVNGVEYSVRASSTANKVFVDIVYDGQFEGGDTVLNVEKIKLSGIRLAQDIEGVSGNIFINGKVTITSVELVGEDFKPIEKGWTYRDDALYILVTLDNPTGYEIDSIDGTVYTKLDNNRYYSKIRYLSGGWTTVGALSTVECHNAYASKSFTGEYVYCNNSVYVLASKEIVYISKAEDLLSMNGNRHYVLTNDIDLSGMEWHGGAFSGFLDGNGYSIKGMSFVGSVTNETAYLGLFKTGTGIVNDLHFEEVTFIVDIVSTTGATCYMYAGALIADASEGLIVTDCSVDKYSVIDLKNEASYIYGGGLVGRVQASLRRPVVFDSCTNAGKIVAESSYVYLGGIVGHVSGDRNSEEAFYDCSNSGEIIATGKTNAFAGGIVGCASEMDGFYNCANSGALKGIVVGGICGSVKKSYSVSGEGLEFESCTNDGNIVSNSMSAIAGGIVGSFENAAIFKNCINNAEVSILGSSAGGIAGSGVASDFINCENTGKIKATAHAGGISGQGASNFENCTNTGKINGGTAGGISGNGAKSLFECSNSGEITATSYSSSSTRLGIGGIVGYCSGATVTNCTNTGNVKATSSYYKCVGGIAGYGAESTYTSCKNTGSVSATAEAAYVGGVVGASYGSALTDCTNEGNVSASGTRSYVGGVVGLSGATGAFNNCVNSGDVTATGSNSIAGGIYGFPNMGQKPVLTTCNNTGKVTGPTVNN